MSVAQLFLSLSGFFFMCTACNEMDYASNNYHVVRGLKFPLGFTREKIESGMDYEPRPDDTFVVTYPKCGTTWTRQIIALLLNDGEIPDGDLSKASPYLDATGKGPAEAAKRPTVISTHHPFQVQPWHPEAKYIIVARNPKDALVSFYHHRINLHSDFMVKDIHEFSKLWTMGEMAYGSYFDFYKSWLPQLTLPNVQLFVYEDMKVDTAKAIREMAQFIGVEDKLEVDNGKLLEKVLENSSVAKMKAQLRKFSGKDFTLVRKGIIGDWKSQLSAEDSESIDKLFRENFNGTLFEHLWDAYDVFN